MAGESLKRRKQRALNAVEANGQITPGGLADYLNAPRDIYPKLPEVSTDDAQALLDGLHDDGLVVSAGGSRFKLKQQPTLGGDDGDTEG